MFDKSRLMAMKKINKSITESDDQLVRLMATIDDTISDSKTEVKFGLLGIALNVASNVLPLEEYGLGVVKTALDVGGDAFIVGAGASITNKFINNYDKSSVISDMTEQEFKTFINCNLSLNDVIVKESEGVEEEENENKKIETMELA